MSFIWNVMLSCSDEEYWVQGQEEVLEVPPALKSINDWLELNGGQLTDLTLESGGSGMNANLFGGGFKHLDVDTFIRVVATQEWRDKNNVQLFLKSEDAGQWTLADLSWNFNLPDE